MFSLKDISENLDVATVNNHIDNDHALNNAHSQLRKFFDRIEGEFISPSEFVLILNAGVSIFSKSDQEKLTKAFEYHHSQDLSANARGIFYHNSRHHYKVTIMALIIGLYHNLPISKLRLLTLVASIHDMDYEVRRSDLSNGFMEERSVERAFTADILDRSNFLQAMEINRATYFPCRLEQWFKDMPENDIRRILADADLVGSVGISIPAFEAETARIEKETGLVFTPAMRAGFLKNIDGLNSVPGTFLETEYKRIVKHVQDQISSHPL